MSQTLSISITSIELLVRGEYPASGVATATFEKTSTTNNVTVSEQGVIDFSGESGNNTDIAFTLATDVAINYSFRDDVAPLTYRNAAVPLDGGDVNTVVMHPGGSNVYEYTLRVAYQPATPPGGETPQVQYYDIDPRVINW